MYQTYHMSDVNVFYNKEDLWDFPREVYGVAQNERVEPYYVVIKLPGAAEAEFMLIQPFTPATKDNLVAWMAGLCDGENYGRLVVYRFPKSELIFGPSQIEARIDQDPEISAQLSLWSQRGSEVIRGNLLVIPLEQSLLYIEPLYLQAETGKIPELQRVILAQGERTVMSKSLAAGLVELFGENAGLAVGDPGARGGQSGSAVEGSEPVANPKVHDLAKQAEQHYAAAQKALQAGDWATYGLELKMMEELLNRLVELSAPVGD